MSHAPNLNWQPSASLENLQQRAQLLQKIREFFAKKNVLEVETPLLSHYGVTDVHLENFHVPEINGYLQTSPEYAMKRLLAAGSGSIYQICKAFRVDECGRFHNPEFSILEWYRVDFNHHQLMDEMDELLQLILQTKSAKRSTYEQLFLEHVPINPLTIDDETLINFVQQQNWLDNKTVANLDRHTLLQVIMSHAIEPNIGAHSPQFVYDFPAPQAALAQLNPNDPRVAERFEVYINGVELANGFHELTDGKQQLQRFENDLMQRKNLGLKSKEIDHRLIAALNAGLPNCAGVALGIDRLLMLKLQANQLADVVSFDWQHA